MKVTLAITKTEAICFESRKAFDTWFDKCDGLIEDWTFIEMGVHTLKDVNKWIKEFVIKENMNYIHKVDTVKYKK